MTMLVSTSTALAPWLFPFESIGKAIGVTPQDIFHNALGAGPSDNSPPLITPFL